MKKKLPLNELKITSFITADRASKIRGGETLKGGGCDDITRDYPCPTFPCQTPPVTGIWCIIDDIAIRKP